MSSLSIEDLVIHLPTRRGTVHAVNNVSLEVAEGEVLGLVGESGCGKSTLARCAVGLTQPTSGHIRIGKQQAECYGMSRRARAGLVQMVFQDPLSSLNPRRTIRQTIAEPMKLHATHEDARTRNARLTELVAKVGLGEHHLDKYPHQLSGGQRQRVGLARALASSPQILICDESVSALDVSVQAQVLNLLVSLQREFGISYLFISHDLQVVRFVAQRIAVMYLGKIVEIAPAEELWNRHRHPYTRALIAASLDLLVDDSVIRPGDPPSPLNPPPGCPFQTRCPRVSDICRATMPALAPAAAPHQVACHHPL